jgi:hypothetical protein
MSRAARERLADWLIVAGAAALLISLFLSWSHQFSPAFAAQWSQSVVLRNVPHDPTAWQVYTVADVLLALLAIGLVVLALRGGRRARVGGLIAVAVALAFVVHALGVPPTNGADILTASGPLNAPASGAGETVALVALAVAICGLALSFTAE